MHRNTKANSLTNVLKKINGAGSWFKSRSNKGRHRKKGGIRPKARQDETVDPSTTLFVDRTQNGGMFTSIFEAEKIMSKVTNHKVKIIERTGTSLRHLLVKS